MAIYKIGVLGAGNMGTAIASGAVKTGLCSPGEILMFNRTAEKREEKKAQGFAVTDELKAVYQSCKWLILGIKPQNFDEVLSQLADAAPQKKPVVISIAAGVPFSKIEKHVGSDCPIIRVMPNTPLMIGEGASALVKNAAASPQQLADVRRLFDAMGTTAVFEKEDMLNEVIPYNGSFPAYVYSFIEAMAQSAVQHGIAYEAAKELICQTMIGSAKMVLQSDKTPQALTQAVCSPGGTTIEAVKVLAEKDLSSILALASDKCIARAYELAKG